MLHQDDAVGPYVVARLIAQYDVPPEVEVVDLGTPGLDMVPYVSDVAHLIVIDTVHATGEPGELRLYDRDGILAVAPQPRLGPHDPSLKSALLTAEFAGNAPADVLLVGVIPGGVKNAVGLTPGVQRAVSAALAQVVVALAKGGHAPVPKAAPTQPDLWWERAAANHRDAEAQRTHREINS